LKEESISFQIFFAPSIRAKEKCFSLIVTVSLWLRFMPSVATRKAKNTQKAQKKKIEREKEAKKKQLRQQLPAKGQKR